MDTVETMFSAETAPELRRVEGAWFGEGEMLRGVLSNVNVGDTFLDVGSNLGLVTIFATGSWDPKVLCSRSSPNGGTRATDTQYLAQWSHNVWVFKPALRETRASRKFVRGDPDAVRELAHLADDPGPSETVETVEYDTLATKEVFGVPRVVKMDVEALNLLHLRNESTLSRPMCGAPFCEIHPSMLPSDVSAPQIIELIESFGFWILARRGNAVRFR
jgi:hypothetical protein